MRTSLLPFALLLISAPAQAQLYAGEVPDGNTAYQVGIDLAVSTEFTVDSADIEFDCDDFMDAQAVLFRGAPEFDAPHYALLDFVDENIEVCMDIATGFQQRPKYYAYGETLNCTAGFEWQFADVAVLGDLGGFLAIGPYSVDSMYIAYRQGSTVGWILLSFELAAQTVRLQIHELLPVCQIPTVVPQNELFAPVNLFPNPSHGGPIRVESTQALRHIELRDATGRTIAQYNGNARTIDAPEISGSYFVRATCADGRRVVSRLVRY